MPPRRRPIPASLRPALSRSTRPSASATAWPRCRSATRSWWSTRARPIDTRAIAERAGARVLRRPFDGYRSQKQFAVGAGRARLGAVPGRRRARQRRAARRDPGRTGTRLRRAAAIASPRLSEYFGKFLRHGNAYPDRVLRLFDRRRGGWRGDREIHEAASVDGSVRTLAGDLIHHPVSFAGTTAAARPSAMRG